MKIKGFLCTLFAAVAFLSATQGFAYDVSGTVAYAGSKSGRIYITLQSENEAKPVWG